MADLYRVRRSYGGGSTIRPTTWENHAIDSAFERTGSAAGTIIGNVIGASIDGLRNATRNAQDRRMLRAIDPMEEAAEAEDFDRLLSLAREFVQQYPQLPQGHASLAAALTERGRYDEAIRATEEAEQLGLDGREAKMMRAEAYERKGSIGNAIAEYSALIRDPVAREFGLFARAQMLLHLGDLDLALADINQSIAELPDGTAYAVRGDIHRARGELEKSIDDYTRAYRLSPDLTITLERRAEVYNQLGKTEEAEADRAAVVRAHGDQAAKRNQDLLDEARALLAYFREGGIRLNIASNGHDIDLGRAKARLKPETAAKLETLKPQVLQLLRDERW